MSKRSDQIRYKNGCVTSDTEAVFSQIAASYDLANTILSLGMHKLWRRKAAKLAAPKAGERILDVCCGTGDLAIALAQITQPPCLITGCDISAEMLEIAKTKAAEIRNGRFEWVLGDCAKLPFEDGAVELVTCGFGIRNVPNFRQGLREMHRVLAGGGRVCILEFTLPRAYIARTIYLLYFRHILPAAGGLISGHFAAYKHLSESVCQWDFAIDLQKELEATGFQNVCSSALSLGIARVYRASKAV